MALVSVGVTIGALYLLLREFATAEKETAASYSKTLLPTPLRMRIRGKLEAILARDAIYKRSDLNLRALGETLNESPHYVSQVISQDLNTSFYELVNAHRIREAQRLLREAPEQTVLTIAMNVGFNSKSAFHAAFRKHAGTTPSGFRNGPEVLITGILLAALPALSMSASPSILETRTLDSAILVTPDYTTPGVGTFFARHLEF